MIFPETMHADIQFYQTALLLKIKELLYHLLAFFVFLLLWTGCFSFVLLLPHGQHWCSWRNAIQEIQDDFLYTMYAIFITGFFRAVEALYQHRRLQTLFRACPVKNCVQCKPRYQKLVYLRVLSLSWLLCWQEASLYLAISIMGNAYVRLTARLYPFSKLIIFSHLLFCCSMVAVSYMCAYRIVKKAVALNVTTEISNV